MENEERFLRTLTMDLANLQSKLNERLDTIQRTLDMMKSNPDASQQHRNLYLLADRIDSARVHMYVAGEYLKGNGERAFIQDEQIVLDYIETMRA